MSLDPENYHPRRLVKVAGAASDANPRISAKSFLGIPASLTYELARTDPDHFKQWIPNTGELSYLGRIKLSLSMTSASTQDLSKLLEGASWELLKAKDYGYDKDKADQGNVYNNAGTVFNLVAMTAPKQEDGIAVSLDGVMTTALANGPTCVKLFTLTKGDDGSYHTNDKDLGINATLTAPWKFVVKSGNLAAVNTATGEIFSYFAIQAEKPVPGDDIQLDFAIKASIGEFSTLVENADGTTSSKAPRLAVYDKKMLWRANLYIDEGVNDWNNKHPWNAPPDAATAAVWMTLGKLPVSWDASWGYNEWNRTRKINPADWNGILTDWTSTGLNPSTFSEATALEGTYLINAKHPAGNGGQVVTYHDWTRFTNGGNVGNAVAYGWGCQDSPFEFDQEVLQEKAQVELKRAAEKNIAGPASYAALPWIGERGAPNANWDNYLFPYRHRTKLVQDGNTYSYYVYSGNDPAKDPDAYPGWAENQHKYFLPINTKVSIPGLSTFLDSENSEAALGQNRIPGNIVTDPVGPNWKTNDYNWQAGQSLYTSGLDCSGFVWRSMSYKRANDERAYLINERPTTSGFASAANGWLIAEKADSDAVRDQPKTLGYVVPGDILVIPGNHIVIVLDSQPSADGTVKRENIQIIQAGKGQNKDWQVMTRQVWNANSGLGVNDYWKYRVKRLRPNE